MKTLANILSLTVLLAGQASAVEMSPNGMIGVMQSPTGLDVTYVIGTDTINVIAIECGPVAGLVKETSRTVEYEMLTGKRRSCSNSLKEVTYKTDAGKEITVRIYNDGVAWKLAGDNLVDVSGAINDWKAEWVDCYEVFFPKNTTTVEGKRYGYPALFEYRDGVFMLLSESGVDDNCAAASFYGTDVDNRYIIKSDGEGEPGWQTAIIGKLGDIVESTLITDNSAPCELDDVSWIDPGVAAWIYWAYNHGSKEYPIVKKYIDMADTLGLPFVLIDAEWDEMQGDHTVTDALDYAAGKGIKPLIWYNSSVGWIDGAPGPKFRLNKPEDREREFEWCAANGIKGVKIDFFSGDNNMNIRYMHELLRSAAKHKLLVNFHGVTIPRGWQRTFPNLVTMEGVYGEEWYNNLPVLTDKASCHNATLPFTRNVVGSMDYTPCAFSDSQHPHITTDAHELALTVLYESGIQHLADRPESYYAQPEAVRNFLGELPSAWDDTYFIDGYPGEFAVIARRKGNTLYIAGINGEENRKPVVIDKTRLPDIDSIAGITVFADAIDGAGWRITAPGSLPEKIDMLPRGGFLIKVQLQEDKL